MMFSGTCGSFRFLPCLVVSFLAIGAQGQTTTPNPRDIVIDGVNYAGDGCPNGSVDYYLSQDGKAFTLTFDQYLVDIDDSPNRVTVAKSCSVRVKMLVPEGWMFALFGVDFRGYADLGPQMLGVHHSEYRIQGSRVVELGKMMLEGPRTENYRKSSDIPLTAAQWSDCGRDRLKTIIIDTRVSVRARADERPRARGSEDLARRGVMTMDTLDGEVLHDYGIAWRRCNRPGGGSGSSTKMNNAS